MINEYTAAHLAAISYKRSFRIKQELNAIGITNYAERDIGDVRIIECFVNNELCIIIRGSANFKNWLRNFSFLRLKTRYGKLHAGFYGASNDILMYIKKYYSRNPPVMVNVIGHSLGGAIAQILGCMLEDSRKMKVASVITFGKPSIGKLTYKYNFTFENYLNNVDAIRRMPGILPGYIDDEVLYFNRFDKLVMYPTKNYILADRLATIAEKKHILELYKDHQMASYKKQMLLVGVGQ